MVDLTTLDTKSLILDMTTNLSRVGNFVLNEDYDQAEYFINELEKYIEELKKREYKKDLEYWINKTNILISNFKERNLEGKYLADDSFTCGIVLQNTALYNL